MQVPGNQKVPTARKNEDFGLYFAGGLAAAAGGTTGEKKAK